jgi:hypothetical protein
LALDDVSRLKSVHAGEDVTVVEADGKANGKANGRARKRAPG